MKKSIIGILSIFAFSTVASAAEPVREWTFMFFENGKNNLEQFLFQDVNEMERVGSNENMNIIVEYGSLSQKRVFRTKLIQDADMSKITSPSLMDLGNADMGDWRQVSDFATWAMKNYPAKHYFLSIADHGSGWHKFRSTGKRGISWDDTTGHHITTNQLALALGTVLNNTGSKIHVYGSDACLMMMAEVAGESWGFADIFAGSQELEPGEGWDYTTWLGGIAQMLATPGRYRQAAADPKFVVSHLTQTFVKDGTRERTFSGFDNNLMVPVAEAVKNLSAAIVKMPAAELQTLRGIADQAFRFYNRDYADLLDLLMRMEQVSYRTPSLPSLDKGLITTARTAVQAAIFVNKATPDYAAAKGLSIWLPRSTDRTTFDRHIKEYLNLRFERTTGWSNALQVLVPANVTTRR